MKLPWNKKYLIISFHIIVTLIAVYSLKYCIDFLAYVISNLDIIFANIKNGIGWLSSIFSVVIVAFVISYLFDPVVDFFQTKYDLIKAKYFKDKNFKIKIKKKDKHKEKEQEQEKDNFKTRGAGTLITYLIIFSIIIISINIAILKISKIGSGDNILETIINSINSSVSSFVGDFSRLYYKIEDSLIDNGIFEYISPHINKFVKGVTSFIGGIAQLLVGSISSIVNGIVNVIISIVIAFYFLKDKALIKSKFENIGETFLHKKVYTFIKNTLGDINAVFSGYIRGMLLDGLIMAILISITLSIIGVKFAPIIGIIAGFSNVIPYFGALIGFILAISVSLISGEPMQAVLSTIMMLVLQQVDGILISPKVVGESVELSPVLVIIALSVAGQVFGLWGMIFAVPIFAVIKIFAIRIYERKKLKKEAKVLNNIEQ